MKRSVADAFNAVLREQFLPEDMRQYAAEDRPLSIGHGQTNSQPTTVRHMLEWLDVQTGMKVLDVGSGSGWTTALLAYLVGEQGHVYAVERVPELVLFGLRNCEKLELFNVTFHDANSEFGLPTKAPFDRILVSAAATELPQMLVNQLAPGGRMVIPVERDVIVLDKKADGTIRTRSHYGYMFVPLVGM